ncbi:MAG: hydroxyacid dehydrogenase, partial [Planctomycetes bacterium]|nr:hydroxyacid dehydrogenase [Planctomycetota bacterium]
MDVFFFEAFEEEAQALRRLIRPNMEAGFTWKTIQEYGESKAPAAIISIR